MELLDTAPLSKREMRRWLYEEFKKRNGQKLTKDLRTEVNLLCKFAAVIGMPVEIQEVKKFRKLYLYVRSADGKWMDLFIEEL